MDIKYKLLPDSSRIWIYQANRKFFDHETKEITHKANLFVNNWSAHQNPLNAGAVILKDQFLILAVDENTNGASGCSIDKSTKFINNIENEYEISLLNRSQIAYLDGNEVRIVSLNEIKKKIDAHAITKDTLIFNNLVERKGELKRKWMIPAKDSWMKKYFLEN